MVTQSQSLIGRKVHFRVQAPTPADDFDATSETTWGTIRSIVGTLRPVLPGSREFVAADKMESQARYFMDVRQLGNFCLSSTHRLIRIDSGRVYEIDNVTPLDERETWFRVWLIQTDAVCKC